MFARIYSLIAEMEILKIEVEIIKRNHSDGTHLLQEKAELIGNIVLELQSLSY